MLRTTTKATVFSCILFALLTSCAGDRELKPFENLGRIWPQPPEVQRIAFVGEFSRSSDLGIEPGVWGRMVRFVVGAQDDAMVRPMAVASSQDGNIIYVADPGARCVHRYNIQRSNYTCLMARKNRSLVSPVGVTVAGDGRVYVSDSQLGAVFRLDVDGKWLEQLTASADLQQPTGIAWDENLRLLFVTDTGTHSVKAFDTSGSLVREFGERGGLPGQANFPTYLWLDSSGELLLTDSLNFRIQRFAEDGAYINTFGQNGDTAGSFARPKGVATDSYGHVYIVDGLLHSIQIFNREGELLLSMGERGQDPGQFWLPNGIYIANNNTIYVADSENRRIQVFRYVGPDV